MNLLCNWLKWTKRSMQPLGVLPNIRRNRCRPTVEFLENRLTPTVDYLVNASGDAGQRRVE